MHKAKVLQDQGRTQQEIAAELGVTDRTVRNYLRRHGQSPKSRVRTSKLDAFKALIDAILEENPFHNRELILERIRKQGYQGRISILRDYTAAVTRKLTTAAVIRFETEPGRQAQVDWKEFGRQTVDGKERKLYAFVMVLGYSRKPFVRFTTSMDQPTLLACHALAFEAFGGVPAEILYDNMRTAFCPDGDGVWRPTAKLMALAAHYGFAPQRCRVRRPETKGKVERSIGYLDGNFWPRMEGRELSLDQLNQDVSAWIDSISLKNLADFGESRDDRFSRERPELRALPPAAFDPRIVVPVMGSREGTVRYQGNRYSIPPAWIGEMITFLIHPLVRSAEIRFPDGVGRTVQLEDPGRKALVFYPGDREEQQKRWRTDRERVARRRIRNRPATAEIEVATGSASAYEALSGALDESMEVPA